MTIDPRAQAAHRARLEVYRTSLRDESRRKAIEAIPRVSEEVRRFGSVTKCAAAKILGCSKGASRVHHLFDVIAEGKAPDLDLVEGNVIVPSSR